MTQTHPKSTYRLTEDGIEDTQSLLDEFSERIGVPRQAIGQRKLAGEEITRAITEARQTLKNRLDPLMRQFNVTGTPPPKPSPNASSTKPTKAPESSSMRRVRRRSP